MTVFSYFYVCVYKLVVTVQTFIKSYIFHRKHDIDKVMLKFRIE